MSNSSTGFTNLNAESWKHCMSRTLNFCMGKKKAVLDHVLRRWTFWGSSYRLMRTFLKWKIWSHSHLPAFNIPEYSTWDHLCTEAMFPLPDSRYMTNSLQLSCFLVPTAHLVTPSIPLLSPTSPRSSLLSIHSFKYPFWNLPLQNDYLSSPIAVFHTEILESYYFAWLISCTCS